MLGAAFIGFTSWVDDSINARFGALGAFVARRPCLTIFLSLLFAVSQLAGVVTVFSFSLFSGGSVTLPTLETRAIPLRWLPSLSFMRYALEALYVGEAQEWRRVNELMGVDTEAIVRSTFGFELDRYWRDVGLLFANALFMRVVAVAVMHLRDRARKL